MSQLAPALAPVPPARFRPETMEFLRYLHAHPELRALVRAMPGRTLLYAGAFGRTMWSEIEELRQTRPEYAGKQTIADVLERVPAPGTPHANLGAYARHLDKTLRVPWQPDGFTIWRALSGIFASNAAGAVSFQVGSGVTRDTKVFAATEIAVLARNPNVDATTRDLLAYFQRCLDRGQADMNVGLMTR